ncbi:pilin [Patescibacteria group bacterium]|nr:pilin [Patescibacteria group bacterium]
MTKNKKILLCVSLCAIVFLVLPHFVLAADTTKTVDLSKMMSDINPLKKYCKNGVCDPALLLGGIIKAALGIVGSIALLMFLYGGFLWLTSTGNEQKITKGKSVLVWAVIGLAVIFMSYAAVNFVIGALTGNIAPTPSENGKGTCVCNSGDTVPNMTQSECADYASGLSTNCTLK